MLSGPRGRVSWMDETHPVKVHKVTLLIVDDDKLGANGVTSVIENARYPNHCIAPTVMAVETREVQWSDEHSLNNTSTQRAEFERMFGGGR